VAPLLVSTFLDSAPSVFSPSNARTPPSPSVDAELLAIVGSIARILYGAVVPRAHDLDDVVNTFNAPELQELLLIALCAEIGNQYSGQFTNTSGIYGRLFPL
jgi:hypothetical protein